jgi:molecular chaperone DnaJ
MRACSGQGRIKRNKTLEVKIPVGIDNGMRIRSSGNGEPGTNGGPSGDLYVEIHIKPRPVFQREGDDLHCEMPISFAKAALGGEIEVPTLSGKVAFVPEGTQSGKTFRLKGKGIKACVPASRATCSATSRSKPGQADRKQKELLRERKSTTEGGAKHSPQTKTWRDKVKDFFE